MSKFTTIFVISMVSLVWATGAYLLPAMGFDESLHAKMVEEMLHSRSFFQVTWEGNHFTNRSPVFTWMGALFAAPYYLMTGTVSLLSLRLVSLASVFGLYFLLVNHCQDQDFKNRLKILFASFWLFSVTALFYQPQVVFAFLICAFLLRAEKFWISPTPCQLPSVREALLLSGIWSIAIFFEGSKSVFIPMFIFLASTAIQNLKNPKQLPFQLWGRVKAFKRILLFTGIFLSGLYLTFYILGAEQFLDEYFFLHKFGVGTYLHKAHSFATLWNILLLVLGSGAVLFAWARELSSGKKPFLIAWVVSVFVISQISEKSFYDVVYIWPALILLSAHAGQQFFRRVFIFPCLLVALVLAVAWRDSLVFQFLPLSYDHRVILDKFFEMGLLPRISLTVFALYLVVSSMVFYWLKFSKPTLFLHAFNTALACLLLIFGVLVPLSHITEGAKQKLAEVMRNFSGYQQFSYAMFSPSLTTFTGDNVKQVGEGDFSVFNENNKAVVLMPIWWLDVCAKYNAVPVAESGVYFICAQHSNKTPAR